MTKRIRKGKYLEQVPCKCGCGGMAWRHDVYNSRKLQGFIRGHHIKGNKPKSKICSVCGTALTQTNSLLTSRNAKCRSCYNLKYRGKGIAQQKANKRKAIEKLGGKCAHCGIQHDTVDIYDFHHRYPQQKLYNVAVLLRKKWSDITDKELNKCILLCANCHRVEHAEISLLQQECQDWT